MVSTVVAPPLFPSTVIASRPAPFELVSKAPLPPPLTALPAIPKSIFTVPAREVLVAAAAIGFSAGEVPLCVLLELASAAGSDEEQRAEHRQPAHQ